jgi:hypothetical protein
MGWVRALIVGVTWLSGCSAAEGPLLHALDAGAAPSPPSIDAAGGAPAPVLVAVPLSFAQDAPWQYQLQGEIDPTIDAELFVIDLFNVDAELIAELHGTGRLAVAYLSAGTFEPFRDDADAFPEAVIGNPLVSYPNESWLDVRDSEVRRLMAARLDIAASKGFDGVLPTNLSADSSDNGFGLQTADVHDYAAWLAAETRGRGMSAGLAGDLVRRAPRFEQFDFAIHFGCIARGDCDLLAPLLAAGKPRLDIETEGDADEVCAAALAAGVNALLKRSDLGAYRVVCP